MNHDKPVYSAPREAPVVKRFHDHLDGCVQCREHPMELCKKGFELLKQTLA